MSFARSVAFILKWEQGIVDDPKDPGGLTNYGIALAKHPELTADDIRHMTPQRAAEIYEGKKYWGAIRGYELPDALQLPMLDTAVVEGYEAAIKFLQAALYVPVDGEWGPQTMQAANLANPRSTIQRFTAERIFNLSQKAGWPHFGKGWASRATAAAMEAQ